MDLVLKQKRMLRSGDQYTLERCLINTGDRELVNDFLDEVQAKTKVKYRLSGADIEDAISSVHQKLLDESSNVRLVVQRTNHSVCMQNRWRWAKTAFLVGERSRGEISWHIYAFTISRLEALNHIADDSEDIGYACYAGELKEIASSKADEFV